MKISKLFASGCNFHKLTLSAAHEKLQRFFNEFHLAINLIQSSLIGFEKFPELKSHCLGIRKADSRANPKKHW